MVSYDCYILASFIIFILTLIVGIVIILFAKAKEIPKLEKTDTRKDSKKNDLENITNTITSVGEQPTITVETIPSSTKFTILEKICNWWNYIKEKKRLKNEYNKIVKQEKERFKQEKDKLKNEYNNKIKEEKKLKREKREEKKDLKKRVTKLEKLVTEFEKKNANLITEKEIANKLKAENKNLRILYEGGKEAKIQLTNITTTLMNLDADKMYSKEEIEDIIKKYKDEKP